MVTSEVGHFSIAREQSSNVPKNLGMRFWPITLTELPHINNVAIENQVAWLNRLQIFKQFFGMTTIRAEVNIGNNQNVNVSFLLPGQRFGFGIQS